MQKELFTLTDLMRILDKESNPRLLKCLIEFHGIPTIKVGKKAIVIDADGLETLRAALAEWEQRPRPTRTGKLAPA